MHNLVFVHAVRGVIHQQKANSIPRVGENVSIPCTGEQGGWNVFLVKFVNHIYTNDSVEITVL